MIDPAPIDAAPPPPESFRSAFIFMTVPSMWSLQDRMDIVHQAQRDFNSGVCFVRTDARTPAEWLNVFTICWDCAGVILMRDQMQQVPYGVAQIVDFFFGRDGGKAMVYEWQPFEKNFRMVDRDWLLARRA